MKPMARRSRDREPLNREAIVEAALQVISMEGLEGFSTRKLAQKLNCEAMSIYHYFPSKAHLMDALVDRAISEMRPVECGASFREALDFVARELRRVAHRYPAFFPYLAVHRLNTRTALGWLDKTIALFRGAGMGDREAAQSFRLLGYYVMGAGLDEAVGYAKGPSAAVPVDEEELMRDFPNVAAAGPYFNQRYWDQTFDRGLDILLDGIVALMRPHSNQGKQ